MFPFFFILLVVVVVVVVVMMSSTSTSSLSFLCNYNLETLQILTDAMIPRNQDLRNRC